MSEGTRGVRVGRWHFLYDKTKTLLSTKQFFYAVIALFVLQAGIVAVMSGFPLAFDESTHLSIIQLHANQWSPFFSNLPESTGQYGPLSTDPSYLYHYLLSFPYRLISLLFTSTFSIVLSLRLINILFFAAGLIVFRKVLSYSGASKALVNIVMLAFVILPLSTFTAAQINYDNLLFLVTALVFLYGAKVTVSISQKKHFDSKNVVLLSLFCLIGAQVKYAFLPIFMGVFLWVSFLIGKWVYAKRSLAWRDFVESLKALNNRAGYAIIALLIIAGGLFTLRYGYNAVVYKTPVPECDKVLSVQACMSWGPWARNYRLGQSHTPEPSLSQKAAFGKAWVYISGSQLFTILDANKGGSTVSPARQFIGGGIFILALGGVLMIFCWRKIMRSAPVLIFYCFVSGTYLFVLIAKNYSEYTAYGIPIAIQGRYLLLVLLLFMIVMARAYSVALHKAPHWKMFIVAFAVLIGIQGGGAITYLSKTDDSWYWGATANATISKPVEKTNSVGSVIVNTAEARE